MRIRLQVAALAACITLSGLVQPVQAQSLTPVLTSVVNNSGVFQYNYDLLISSNTNIRPNDFITFYDFNGLQGGANAPTFTAAVPGASFSISVQNTGITPNVVSPLTPDSAAIPNVTFTYTGVVIMNPPAVPSSAIVVGTATISSTFSLNPFGSFTNYTSETENGQSGQRAATTSAIQGPNQQLGISPEPATFALLALGTIAGTGFVQRKRIFASRNVASQQRPA